MATTTANMPRLLAADAQRSDDPDIEAPVPAAAASPSPNLETAPNMQRGIQRVTGTFADPSHEAAFAAQLFRMAYPAHVLLLAVILAECCWSALCSSRDDGVHNLFCSSPAQRVSATLRSGTARGARHECECLLHTKPDCSLLVPYGR